VTAMSTSSAESTEDASESSILFARGSVVLSGSVSSPAREASSGAAPIFLDRGFDGRVSDVDGNEYVDLVMANGSLIHGHAQEDLRRAMHTAMGRLSHGSIASRPEVEFAEYLCGHIPSAEMVRFFSTGTEAAMAAVRIARAATGRHKILKFEGNYHGWSDGLCVSSNPATSRQFGDPRSPIPIPDTSGLPPAHLSETVVVPWNAPELLQSALRDHGHQLAAVICEPFIGNVGLLVPNKDFVATVRRMTSDAGVLLILDETHSGMRHSPGTAQQSLGVVPDLTTIGKALGAGFPVAAVLGSGSVMSTLRGGMALPGGTHNGNVALMTVALTSARRSLSNGAELLHALDDSTRELVGRLVAVSTTSRRRKVLVQSAGSAFQIHVLKAGVDMSSIDDARQFGDSVDLGAYDALAAAMRAEGVLMVPSGALHCVLSTSHTPKDLDDVVHGYERALASLERSPLW